MTVRLSTLLLCLFALLSVFTLSTFGQEETKTPAVRGADSADVIPNQYIVVFNDTVDAATIAADLQNSRAAGVAVDQVYETVLNGFSAELSEEALNDLLKNPAIAYIEADQLAHIVDTQSNATWGLDRIDQRDLPLNSTYTYNTSGVGVDAYIVDTGIRITHNEFSGRIASTGYTAINDGNGYDDCNGHGTHVAGTVGGTTYGVAKDVTLYAVRVLGCNGSGSYAGVIAGIDWVTSNAGQTGRPSVANMSLGGGVSSAVDDAVRNSVASGVTYAIAAGNDNANACNASPARVNEAITVGSTTSSDSRSSFSNFGTCVDVFAPGSSITSAWINSDSSTNTISGTSMATPHVAGVIALILEGSPSASPAQIFSEILNTATPDKVGNPGSGSPNLLLCTDNCTEIVPPTPTLVPDGVFCSDAVVTVVDNGSVTTSLNVSDGRSITDLNVSLTANHTWVGDLSFTLTHNGQAVTLVDRPSVPGSTYGCSADDIDATLDDEASTSVENTCGSNPALGGSLQPNQSLAAFDGQSVAGTWELTIADAYSADGGALTEWCLIADLDTGTPPTATPVPPTTTPEPPTPTTVPPTPTTAPPTSTPEPPSGSDLYLSFEDNATLNGVTFADEDVVSVDTTTNSVSIIFDGSQYGVSADLNAFAMLPDGSYLMSFATPLTIGGVSADDSDIVRFDPTTETFEMYLDGSDVNLTSSSEDIDAIGIAVQGDLIISTTGSHYVNGSSLYGTDEDLLVFYATSLGDNTSGSFVSGFDGSDVGLTSYSEDVTGVTYDGNGTGDIYLSTLGSYSVSGLSGNTADVIICSPTSLGTTTACDWSLYWSGTQAGISTFNAIDGLFVDFGGINSADSGADPTAVTLNTLNAETTLLSGFVVALIGLATLSFFVRKRSN